PGAEDPPVRDHGLRVGTDRRGRAVGVDDLERAHGSTSAEAWGRGGAAARTLASARISAAETVWTPGLATSSAAAREASPAASATVPPAARASASAAVTVSPAPETS